MLCSVTTRKSTNMPRGKKKKSEPEPEIEETAGAEIEQDNLNNPNIEEYLPKPQTEWFHMVIQAQVKKVIEKSMQEQQQQFTEQLEQFKKSMKHEITEMLETSLKNIETKCQRERSRLETTLYEKLQKVEDLNLKMDCFEQDRHKSSIQIVGLAETEDDSKAILKLSKDKLGIKLKSADIEEVTRLGKKQKSGQPRNTVVKFTNECTRNKVYDKRRKLMTSSDPKSNIYINDRLTNHRQHVLYAARRLVKSHKLFAAWSQTGNVLVRKTENSKITQVHSHDDLRNLVMEQVASSVGKKSSETVTHLSEYSFDYDSEI